MKLLDRKCAVAVVTAGLLASTAAIPVLAQREKESNVSERGFVGNIVQATTKNSDYRRVLFTGKNMQLVVMTLQADQDIGEETHDNIDQFIRVEAGTALVTIGSEEHRIEPGFAVVIPAGASHNVVNTGTGPLQLYTLYTPPEHPPGTVQASKPAEH